MTDIATLETEISAAISGAADEAELATELGDELLALSHDVVVVLDDYHAVGDRRIDDFFTALLRYPPPRFRLVLASRVDPVLPLARAAVKLGAGVLPDGAVEGQDEILEVVISFWTRDLFAGCFAHGVIMP